MQITDVFECPNKTVTRQSSSQRKSRRPSGKLHCLNETLGPVCLGCEAPSSSVSLSMLKVLALIDLYDKISSTIDRCEFSIGVFLDLWKAFDTVDHSILLDKLEHYGIRGLALQWVKSYLTSRLQFDEFKGHSSFCHKIVCGVPQGSILGFSFFSVYVNDLSKV